MVSMTLVAPLPKNPRLANPDHPRFVGLALLRSLLLHEEVATDATRSDAVLDLIGLLLRDAPAASVIRAFCKARRASDSICYLANFRLRRWLEQQMVVKAGRSGWQPLSLAFGDLRRIEQHYRRQAWEAERMSCDWNTIPVSFAWNCAPVVETEVAVATPVA